MPGRESDLIEAVQPIRGLALATSLHHFFSSGLFDRFAAADGPLSAGSLAAELGFDETRLLAVLRFLRNEDFLEEWPAGMSLSQKARRWSEFRPWYEMMVGGYAKTFMAMGDALVKGSAPAPRVGELVGSGSCGISMHDSIPIVRRLLERLTSPPELVIDLGCGSGVYLTEICRLYPKAKAVGIEPDAGACRAAELHVGASGLSDRIQIVEANAVEYISRLDRKPDVVLLGFVLHEVLGQSGEQAAIEMLTAAMSGSPSQRLIIIDIDYRIDDPTTMRHQLALGYYNAYFLLHPFTSQQLALIPYWEELFARCGLEVEARLTTDPDLDSTQIEVGWMLARIGAKTEPS